MRAARELAPLALFMLLLTPHTVSPSRAQTAARRTPPLRRLGHVPRLLPPADAPPPNRMQLVVRAQILDIMSGQGLLGGAAGTPPAATTGADNATTAPAPTGNTQAIFSAHADTSE
jgi:hypothetical protein